MGDEAHHDRVGQRRCSITKFSSDGFLILNLNLENWNDETTNPSPPDDHSPDDVNFRRNSFARHSYEDEDTSSNYGPNPSFEPSSYDNANTGKGAKKRSSIGSKLSRMCKCISSKLGRPQNGY